MNLPDTQPARRDCLSVHVFESSHRSDACDGFDSAAVMRVEMRHVTSFRVPDWYLGAAGARPPSLRLPTRAVATQPRSISYSSVCSVIQQSLAESANNYCEAHSAPPLGPVPHLGYVVRFTEPVYTQLLVHTSQNSGGYATAGSSGHPERSSLESMPLKASIWAHALYICIDESLDSVQY